MKKGYELVENGFDADGQPNFDRDANNINEDGVQEFIVRLAPKIVEFSATQPIQAGQVVPGDSEGRVYPTPLAPAGQTTADLDHLSETVTRTVTYVTEDQDGSNRQSAGIADQTDRLHFARKGTINLVTGETSLEDWTAQDGTSFVALENPVKKGYVVVAEESTDAVSSDLTKAGEHTGIHADAADITDTVIYRPVGAYRISYATGKEPAHAQKEITYLNDPTNPTAIASPTDTLPYVEGLEPKDAHGQVLNLVDPLDETKGYLLPSPESPTADTAITYAITKGSVRVRFLTEGGDTDLQEAQDLATEVDFGTKYTSEAPTEITKDGRIYHLVGHRADSADPSGTVTKGMKTVIYDYKLATGTVIARFVIQDTSTELQPELAIATNVDNGTHYVASAPDEISYDGHIYERIGAAEQTGKVEVGTTILIFAYKVKEIPTPQPSPETEKEETVSPLPSVTKANTTDAHEEKGSALLSNKEEEKPLETTSQKEELPEVVPNTPQEGTHLPATGEETSQLALLGLGLLAGLSSLIPYKKKQE
ncbi:MAG: LPXTG cell wall anchor domain-containing protein [Streptococcus sp.]|nr:LPXTG cell wall anchor domain-containing protein [Streptococcus sp.]